jgi:hypothetical protein
MRRLATALGLLAAAAAGPAAAEVRIEVEHPPPGSSFAGDLPAFVAGWAAPPGHSHPRRDVVVVIDVSASTLEAFERPEVPERPDAAAGAPLREGSVLEVEISATRRLLRTLDPRFTRVAVVTFSGEPLGQSPVPPRWTESLDPAATTWVGLTHNWSAVERALDAVAEAGAHGLTHIAAGVERATAELTGRTGAESRPDPGARHSILFMTDGIPTLPVPGDTRRNQLEVFKQVRRAAKHGIEIHAYAVGREALRGPFTLETMATETGGTFTAVRDPATLPDRLPVVQLAGLDGVQVRNLTTERDALATHLRPDGTFDALVKLAPGANRIEVVATAIDGESGRRVLVMERRDAASGRPALPEHLVSRRGELLEKDLEERREAHRQQLGEEIRRGRADDEESEAAAQRRELELEVGREPPSVGASPEPPPPAAD